MMPSLTTRRPSPIKRAARSSWPGWFHGSSTKSKKLPRIAELAGINMSSASGPKRQGERFRLPFLGVFPWNQEEVRRGGEPRTYPRRCSALRGGEHLGDIDELDTRTRRLLTALAFGGVDGAPAAPVDGLPVAPRDQFLQRGPVLDVTRKPAVVEVLPESCDGLFSVGLVGADDA